MDKDELWQRTLELLLKDVSANDPKSVFLNLLTPFGIFGDQFILQAQGEQVEEWVRNNYLAEMREKLELVSGRPYNIGIGSGSPAPAPDPAPIQPVQPEPVQIPQTSFSSQPQTHEQPSAQPDWMNTYVRPEDFLGNSSQDRQPNAPAADGSVNRGGYSSDPTSGEGALFSKCTFENFIVGNSNQFAHGAALAVAERPGMAYNPLFIYGNSGLGKTHLLIAIANYTLQNYPMKTTRYVSANGFLNDFVDATTRSQWGDFNRKYHQVDILLVDDVQYLEGKDETINQLFNIFNEMTSQNKQIVLSADRAPKDIDMDERMRSRFVAGLLADVKPPDYETRLAILKKSLQRANEQASFFGVIPDEVLGFLAETTTSNIREMEGAINRLVSHMTLLRKSSITIDEARELLQDFFPNDANKQIDIAVIQSEVERFFGITHDDMISSKRSKGITVPRHIAIYLSRFMTEESLESIGKKFGGRDHTTVMHSVNKIEREQKDNRVLFDQIDQLTIRIKERS